MNDPVITLRGVYKSYPLYEKHKDRLKEALHPFGKKYHHDFNALTDISLDIDRSEIVGIVGKNGSGKSTLLKLVANVLTPSKGKIYIRDSVTPLLELGAGLNPEFSGIENINFYGSILGIEHARIQELLKAIIEFADIGEHIYHPLKTYSSGMKSRLGFSIAVHIDPKILIVDEVLSVGDIAFQRKCYRKMEELFMRGSTVLYVSHNTQSVVQLCNRAILLHEGRLLMDGTPDRVVKSYQKLLFEGKMVRPEETKKAVIDSGTVESAHKDADVKNTSKHHPDFYLEALKSEPFVTNGHITEFSEVLLTDAKGLIVNQLKQGERYTLNFLARFSQTVSNIAFGAQLMTLQGVIVSGANMASNQGITFPKAEEDDTIAVTYEFKCLLVPGVYVIKIFSAPEDGTPASITEDALMFQVRPQKKENGGYVYLDQSIYAKKVDTG